jgi:hypothetical protein
MVGEGAWKGIKRLDNVFGDKSKLNMEIKPHMWNNGHLIKEMP